ncbi:MAG: hypothetical protein FWE35_25845 [Streptosporangiales bacterium]|nr:hypothetical protein [Streptosporangiales bacterium]
MWTYSLANIGLSNRAFHGCTSAARPSTSVNPVGWFIHALTAITKKDPATPATAMGMPHRKWIRGDSLSQP